MRTSIGIVAAVAAFLIVRCAAPAAGQTAGAPASQPAASQAAASRPAGATAPEPPVPEDVKDVPCAELRAGGDEQKRFFLIGAKPERREAVKKGGGYRVLIVLPGGDGGDGFNPFVRRIYKNVLDERWLIVQLVSPTWDVQMKQSLVWPTERFSYPAAKFTTEAQIDAALAEAKQREPIDAKRVYLMGWSSAGPAVYSYMLRKDAPIAGTFVLMSVFKPEQLPDLAAAKGRRFYLLQSPDDKITKFEHAEKARDALQAAGAEVKLQAYPGGHGFRGDVWGMIRDGVKWLDDK